MNIFSKFFNMDTETLYSEMICLENTGIIRRTPVGFIVISLSEIID